MSETVQDHPDIEKLPLEVDGVAVREVVRAVFRDSANGTPDNISKAGCLALASKGYLAWNLWRVNFPPTSTKYVGVYRNTTDFSNTNFTEYCNFNNFSFGERANFSGSTFSSRADFKNAKFDGYADFSHANFSFVFFHDAEFGSIAQFSGAHLSGAHFHKVKFKEAALFNGCSFDTVSFKGSQFYSDAEFIECIFSKKAIFGSNDGVPIRFAKVPVFHKSSIHPTTWFDESSFPALKGTAEAAHAYRTLKLAFNQQQAIREEQRFFRLEMAEETLRETGIKRWLFVAYKQFSDYGFSVTRPLAYGGLAVLVLSLIYGLLSWIGQCGLSIEACRFAPQWLEFSLLQTWPLPGLDKLSEAASKAFWPKGAWWNLALSTLVIAQKIVSLAALFLVGLALRNLFKLK